MALRFLIKKAPSTLAGSRLLIASAPAAAAAAPVARSISEGGVRTLNNIFGGVIRPRPAIPNNSGLHGLAARQISTFPCCHRNAKISCPRTGIASIDIDRIKRAFADFVRGGKRTFSSSAGTKHQLYAPRLEKNGADFEQTIRYLWRAQWALNFSIFCLVSLRLYRINMA